MQGRRRRTNRRRTVNFTRPSLSRPRPALCPWVREDLFEPRTQQITPYRSPWNVYAVI